MQYIITFKRKEKTYSIEEEFVSNCVFVLSVVEICLGKWEYYSNGICPYFLVIWLFS